MEILLYFREHSLERTCFEECRLGVFPVPVLLHRLLPCSVVPGVADQCGPHHLAPLPSGFQLVSTTRDQMEGRQGEGHQQSHLLVLFPWGHCRHVVFPQ